MSTLPEETPGRPRDLSALRPAVKKRRTWIRFAVVVLAIATLCDWMRPPSRQVSVVLYNNIVIKGYRLLLQPWGNYVVRCRFHPTCSIYSEQAMEKHGFPKGVWLTTSRLFRCMPWVPFGTADPVPPAAGEARMGVSPSEDGGLRIEDGAEVLRYSQSSILYSRTCRAVAQKYLKKSWTGFCMTDNNGSKRRPQGCCFGRAKRGVFSGENIARKQYEQNPTAEAPLNLNR